MIELIKSDERIEEDYPFLKKMESYPLQIFENTGEDVRKTIDLIITLGGDGTILWASK